MSDYGHDSEWDEDILDVEPVFGKKKAPKIMKVKKEKTFAAIEDLDRSETISQTLEPDISEDLEELEIDKPEVPLGRSSSKTREAAKKIKYRVVSQEEFIRLKNEYALKQKMQQEVEMLKAKEAKLALEAPVAKVEKKQIQVAQRNEIKEKNNKKQDVDRLTLNTKSKKGVVKKEVKEVKKAVKKKAKKKK